MLTLEQVAVSLSVSDETVRRMVVNGILRGERLTPTSPWRIRPEDLKEYAERMNVTLRPLPDEKK